ncbi:hypothetical protein KY329_01375 [Candidatus Woesearchaeota archaeon]|nr:hypothetical protein [Candidatus Woesearchaeota archaeon]
MASETLEARAKVHDLPPDDKLGLVAEDTRFYSYFHKRPNTCFALFDEEGLPVMDSDNTPVFDRGAVRAYEKDLNEIYRRVFRKATGAKPSRTLHFNELGLELADVCLAKPIPVVGRVETRGVHDSNRFPGEIARALTFDLRYAAKLALDDAESYKRKGYRGISYTGAVVMSFFMMLAAATGAYIGMSLAVDKGIDRVRTELRKGTDEAINKARTELREELDDAVDDYGWNYFRQNSSREQPHNENSNKPRKND